MTQSEQIKELQKQIADLKAQVPTKKAGSITLKIGDKGNIVVYGLQRFPFCFYLNQALKLKELFNSPVFAEFLSENQEKLSKKAE